MEILEAISQNILSPAVLFFALGCLAGVFKSDLQIPDSISRYLSIYLMMAIGFKGGVAIAATQSIDSEVLWTIAAGLSVGLAQPFAGYYLLRLTTRLDSTTAAAVAAHYGSISIVTFATAVSFLKTNDIVYAGYVVAVVALMEAPAIFSGLYIAHRANPKTNHAQKNRKLLREIFTNGAILLLLGSFVIGCVTGQKGMEKLDGFLNTPFQGILCLFLLDMGLMVSKNLHSFSNFSWRLALFAIYMPVLGALTGVAISYGIGLQPGTALLFTVLCASASYIAVPAAMRLAVPEAKAAIYLPMSLAITFPFNVVIGIPLYYTLVSRFLPPT